MSTLLKSILFFVVFFFFNIGAASAQQFKWVRGGGTGASLVTYPNDEGVYYMCTDYNGNIYTLSVVGYGTVIADTFSQVSPFLGVNALFSSYTCSGQMRFSKLIGSSANALPQGLALDSFGHVYLAVDLPHGTGSHFVNLGYDTSFSTFINNRESIIQYDTSGHLHWMRFVGNNSATSYTVGGNGTMLAIGRNNNPHLISYMRSGVVISPSFTSVFGTQDMEYDSSGNLLSCHRLQLDSSLAGSGAATDKQSGKLYLYGARSPAFSDSSFHPYLAAFDTNRHLIWKDTLSNPYYPNNVVFSSIVVDSGGHLYLSGVGPRVAVYKNDSVKNLLSTPFTPSAPVSFVLKTDTAGNPFWMNGFSGSTGVNSLLGLTLMPANKLAVVGYMGGKVKNGYDSIVSYTGEGHNSDFAILDTGGNVLTLQQIHGTGFYDQAKVVVADAAGSLYIGGQVESNTWGGTITPYSTVGGNTDFYIMKYGVDCSCTGGPLAAYTSTGSYTVNFTYTGPTASLDSVRWTFGDGGTSTALNPVHGYPSAGTYHACVKVYAPCGSDIHCTDVVTICTVNPVASYTSSGVPALAFTYTGAVTGVDSVRWLFGDGGTSTVFNPAYTYAAPGTYVACVKAYSYCASDTECHSITVPCVAAPMASFVNLVTFPTAVFSYTGTLTGVDSIKWDFDDGSTGTGTSTVHNYAARGVRNVCVTAYSPCGNDMACKIVDVGPVTVPYLGAAAISIYPNPATNELNVAGLTEPAAYRLLSIASAEIAHGLLVQGANKITLATVPPGIYILELTGEGGARSMHRVVVRP